MRRLTAVSLALFWLAGGVVHGGTLDPDLDAILSKTAPDATVSTLVFLTDQVDTFALTDRLDAERATLQRRHEVVVRSLQALAQATQGELLQHLEALKAAGRVADYRAFWIANVIRVDAPPAEIRALAERPDVERIYYNYPIELVEPVGPPRPTSGHNWSPENGVVAVRAPEVWALGITGEGELVANIDTGVDGAHPALASRWAGVADPRYQGHPEWAWFDPYLGQNDFPYDTHGHGTHTMGTVCGGAPGDEIGVAPGAFWIAAGAIDRGGGVERTVADAILSFEWMVDPDGNPSTNWDVPDVCSNSWGLMTAHGYPPCDPLFWSYLDACEAAGTVIIFSAGNEGPSPNTLRRPADRATDDYRTLAVAAVDAHDPSWPIASFSSRGPTYCTPTGDPATKPDIAAPGVNVRSSVPGGGYAEYSGTSMASPHVNGVVALIRQANPDLSVEQIKQIIFDTAYDLGTAGEDNSYGWGMVDAYEAVQLALSLTTLTFSFPNGRPDLFDPNGGTTIRVEVTGQSTEPEPGTGMFYYSTNGSDFVSEPMIEVSPNVYDAVFPAFDCGATVYYYFSAETTDGEVVYNPFRAPDINYTGLAYSRIELVWADDFETDQGWTVINENVDTGAWVRAVPSGSGGSRGDPPNDHDGSGRCYVTGNGYDEDVDGGPTRLLSPIFDLSGGLDYVISYARWFYNDDGDDTLDVEINNGGGWVLVERVQGSGGWVESSFHVSDYVTPTANVQLRFSTADQPNDSVTEAGLDAFAISAYVCDEPAEAVLPTDYTIVQGQQVSGGLQDLFESDDSRLVLTHSALFPPWVELEVLTTSPSASATRLQFTCEAHPTAAQVEQRIRMYDYAAGQWEVVDVRVMPTTDLAVRVEITDNPTRFIDPATQEMKTRIRWMGSSFINLFGWNAEVDQTIWRITP